MISLFKDIEPVEVKQHWNGGDHRFYSFPNGYGASVIPDLYQGMYVQSDEEKFELAVLNEQRDLVYDTPITDDVMGNLTEENVQEILKLIRALGSKE